MAKSVIVLRGIYTPRDFVKSLNMKEWHVNEEYANICNNPENKNYWDAWESILINAFFIDKDGNKYHLWQDGDLLACCYDLMTAEEKQNMGFEV